MEEKLNFENAFHDEVIKWKALEYIQHKKGWKWFFVAGLTDAVFCIYAAISQNWIFLIALILFSAIYIWQHDISPRYVDVIVSHAGIKVGDKEYPYQNIRSFWLIYRPPYVKILHLRLNSKYLPDLAIQLGDQDPVVLRNYLCSQIHEDTGKEEDTLNTIVRLLKL